MVDRRISEVHVTRNHEIMLITVEGGIPVFCGQGNHGMKLVRLMAFWNQVVRQQGPSQLDYIDLRYDDQVVAKWKDSRTGRGQADKRRDGIASAPGVSACGERFNHTQRIYHG
jgi:cell division septal protein FtsQ